MSGGCLWLAFDQNDIIRDRVFRKDVHMDEYSWTDGSKLMGRRICVRVAGLLPSGIS